VCPRTRLTISRSPSHLLHVHNNYRSAIAPWGDQPGGLGPPKMNEMEWIVTSTLALRTVVRNAVVLNLWHKPAKMSNLFVWLYLRSTTMLCSRKRTQPAQLSIQREEQWGCGTPSLYDYLELRRGSFGCRSLCQVQGQTHDLGTEHNPKRAFAFNSDIHIEAANVQWWHRVKSTIIIFLNIVLTIV
jgi:hypothetical protein